MLVLSEVLRRKLNFCSTIYQRMSKMIDLNIKMKQKLIIFVIIFLGCQTCYGIDEINPELVPSCKDYSSNGNLSNVLKEISESLKISTAYNFLFNMTQLDIEITNSPEIQKKIMKITVQSDLKKCLFNESQIFYLNNSQISIPEKPTLNNLNMDCNYTLNFNVDGFCFKKYYEIIGQKPCQNIASKDFIPNEILQNFTISSFRDNVIRLNLLLTPTREYFNHTAYVIITSKEARCHLNEEYKIKLNEKNITLPRVKEPFSYMESGCEYFIDIEVDTNKKANCLRTSYTVPNFCQNKYPKAKLKEIEEVDEKLFKVFWDPGIDSNVSYKIVDVAYSLKAPPSDFDHYGMLVKNDLKHNFSILNLTQLPVNVYFILSANFVNDQHCSSLDEMEFKVLRNDQILLFGMSSVIFMGILFLLCIRFNIFKLKFIYKIRKFLFGSFEQQDNILINFSSGRKNVSINPRYVPMEMENCDQFEIVPQRLNLEKVKGEGTFGIVYSGQLYDIKKQNYSKVAVKTIREYAPEEEVEALLEEITILKKIASNGSHQNVIQILGCCQISKPYKLILEYLECDLKEYLVSLRDQWKNKRPINHSFSENNYIRDTSTGFSGSYSPLPSPTETETTTLSYETEIGCPYVKAKPILEHTELQNFALQIAKGMAFLESIPIVHRDLAARNVLMDDNKTLKISDFGMSRIGDYFHKNNKKLPIRWMAPESIELCSCTSKSDVWSFGVVLWEIGTLGAFPYQSIANERLLSSLKQGTRLVRPEVCTDELYSIMLKCWAEDSSDRPTFKQLEEHLNGVKSIYLDFRKLNPAYVFPPTVFSS